VNAQEAHDTLLTWCSEIGSASLDEFRRACLHLKLRAGDAARGLSMLGHVEFDYDGQRLAAAPSTLTTIPGLPGMLLLTGARGQGLIGRLAELASSGRWDVDFSRDLCHQFGIAPSSALIDADPADAADFADAAGIDYVPAVAQVMSTLLPAVRVETATVAHRPDNRFPHALVDPETFRPRWDDPGRDGEPGLWLYRSWGRRREMIMADSEGEPRLVLDADCAPYLMRRPDHSDPIIEYRRSHRLLIVNAAAPLPALQARCACLCSGRLPIRRDVAPGVAYHHYVNVDPRIAERILRSLGGAA
jgi:hypothetical protein